MLLCFIVHLYIKERYLLKNSYPKARHLSTVALVAGEIMRSNFKAGMKKEWKEDETPLTVTDTIINELVLKHIGESFPNVRVIGEEGVRLVPGAEYTVLCDPVDGTIPFCTGIPVSAFCISVIKGNIPLSAVIYDPFQKRMWYADKGGGAHLHYIEGAESSLTEDEGRSALDLPTLFQGSLRITASNHRTIYRSNICMVWWKGSLYNLHDVCEHIMNGGAKWMNPCSIAYFGGLVASGELEATIFPGQKGWETAAMQLIVEEAGGKATDIAGYPLKYSPEGEIQGHIISNGLVHDELVAITRKCL